MYTTLFIARSVFIEKTYSLIVLAVFKQDDIFGLDSMLGVSQGNENVDSKNALLAYVRCAVGVLR